MDKDKKHPSENKNNWNKEAAKKDWHKVAEAHAEKMPESKHAPSSDAASKATSVEINPEKALDHPNYEELENKLTATEMELNKLRSDWLSVQAEMANTVRRAERDIANAHKYGMEKFALELLPIIDNLERSLDVQISDNNEAIKNLHLGIELTLKMFLEALKKFSIMQLNPVGETFDPAYHTAMTVQEKPGTKPNTVLQVLQKGYLLKDRLLRPAAVIVSK